MSTNGFSKTTIEDARADKIGLMVFDPVNLTHNIVVKRRINDRYSERETQYSILLGERKPEYPLIYWDDRFYRIEDFLSENDFAVNLNALPNIPFLPENNIAEYANNVLLDARFDFVNLPIEERAAVYYEIAGKPRFVEMSPNELGRYYFDTNSIELANSLISQVPRKRFTFVHEIGHSALHRSNLKEIAYSITDNDGFDECLSTSEIYIPRMEYQANLFASHLLMPNSQFFQQVKRSFSDHNIHHDRLYVDNQQCNMHDYIVVISEIAYHFGVSKRAVEIRLRNNGLIEYGFSYRSIGQVINEVFL